MTLDTQHRSKAVPFRDIPEKARFWVLWPRPEGWPEIRTEQDASLAADSWVAGHAQASHRCYVGESPPGIPTQIIVVCETCPRPK